MPEMDDLERKKNFRWKGKIHFYILRNIGKNVKVLNEYLCKNFNKYCKHAKHFFFEKQIAFLSGGEGGRHPPAPHPCRRIARNASFY